MKPKISKFKQRLDDRFSEEEYVSKVLKFVNDSEYRKKIENKIIEKKHVLFYEKKSSDEYNKLFKNIYEKHSGFKIKTHNTIKKIYNNMLKITDNNTKIYKTFVTNNNKQVYVDEYSLVWTLDNYKHLISDGMLFRNIVYNDKTTYTIKGYIYDIMLSYPRVIPIIENNYEKKQIDILLGAVETLEQNGNDKASLNYSDAALTKLETMHGLKFPDQYKKQIKNNLNSIIRKAERLIKEKKL